MTRTRLTLLLAGGAALVALAIWRLPVNDWVLGFAERVRGAGAAGVALFVAVYLAATVTLIPASLLTLAAGFVYGPAIGLLIVSPTSVLSATAAFLLGRTVLRERVRRLVAESPKAAAVDRAIGRNSFKLILLLRLSPVVPFGLLNYALGLSPARASQFVVASFIGMLPGTWLYVYLGSLATTTAELTEVGGEGGAARLALTVVGLAATVAVFVIVTRAARRALTAELE